MAKMTVNEALCKGCELCIDVCSSKIITLANDRLNGKGYKPAEVTDMNKCKGCALCAIICPDVAITVER